MSISLQLYQLQSQYPQHSILFDNLFKKYELVNDCDDDILTEQIHTAIELYTTHELPNTSLLFSEQGDKSKKIIKIELNIVDFPELECLIQDKDNFESRIDEKVSFIANYLHNADVSTGVTQNSLIYEIEYPQTNRILTEYSQAVMMAFIAETIGDYLTVNKKNIQVSM